MTGPRPDPATRERLVAAAARIGARLVADAVWTEHGCTWRLLRPAASGRATASPTPELAGGMLYEGTAGIALFLAELHRVAPGDGIARAARGAVEFALHEAARLPDTSFGLYTGRVGIAYAAVRAGLRLGMDLRARAQSVLHPLAGNEHADNGIDALGGAAGAIPGLLWLSDHLDPDFTLGMARRLGERLHAAASRHPLGWSWGATPMAAGALCGYSHGASGMAHAFLELYHRTGDGRYRHAAEQALLYERSLLSVERGNWPDLRHRDLGVSTPGGLDGLRGRVREGWRPAPPGYVCFWCHGAAGIGLVRLRAYQVLGAERYLDEARIAAGTVLGSLDGLGNHSLCHGAAGNCETLLAAARVLGEEALGEHAVRCALGGIARYEDAGERWPCGTQGGEPDPGLLLGEAGIGLFLLRLAEPEIESVLLVTAPRAAPANRAADDEGYRSARHLTLREHLGHTLRRFAGLGVRMDALIPPRAPHEAPAGSDVAEAYAAVRARIEREDAPFRRELLEDAFALERARYDLLASAADGTEELVESLLRSPPEEIDWSASRFQLSPRTRVVEVRYDWDRWRPEDGVPEPREAAYVLHRSGANLSTSELTPLAAAVLQGLARPASLEEVTRAVAGDLAGAPDDAGRRWLREQVREQLVRAYRAGIVLVRLAAG